MITSENLRKQAVISAGNRSGWNLDWRTPEPDDVEFFAEHPSARFVVRPWRFNDDPVGVGTPPIGHQFADLKDLELITIVYRAGCRIVRTYHPQDHVAWRHAHEEALYILALTPEIGQVVEDSLVGCAP